MPFKTAGNEQQHSHHHYNQHQGHSSGSGAAAAGSISLDSQLPVNVGGQAAYDFISSYDAPASGLLDNSLNAAAFAGSSPSKGVAQSFNFDNIQKGAPASAVETLREILNKNIPYTDQALHQATPHDTKAIDVQYSDQGLGGNQLQQEYQHQEQHDTNQEQQFTEYGAPPLSISSSSSSSGFSDSFPTGGFGDFPSSSVNDQHLQQNTFGGGGGLNDQPQHFQLPTTHQQLPHQTQNNYNNYQTGADSNPVQQYEIPPDPNTYVPAFKPLSKAPALPYYGRYGAPVAVAPAYAVAPVQAVYQTHSVATAYGPPAKYYRPAGTNNNNNFNNHHHHPGGAGPSSFGNGLGPIGGPSGGGPSYKGNMYLPPLGPSKPHQTYGFPPGGPNRRTHFEPFNGRRHFINKMHGKRSNGFPPMMMMQKLKGGSRGNVNINARRNGGGGPPSAVAGPPMKLMPVNAPQNQEAPKVEITSPAPSASPSPSINHQPIVVADQQQPEHESNRLQDTLGVDIEVHKSIGFELDGQGNAKLELPDVSPVVKQSTLVRRNSVDGDNDLEQGHVSSSLATGPIYSRPYSSSRQQTPKMYSFHRY